MISKLLRLAALAAFALLIAIVGSVVTAANTIPTSHAVDHTQTIGPNDLKPSNCAAITLTNLVIGSGLVNGTSNGDLILGSANIDTISGGNGDDCILGGGGNDTIVGGNGSVDICLGGPGTDVIDCETAVQ